MSFSLHHRRLYLEGHLGGEDKLVSLKQSSSSIHEDQVSDAVNKIYHPLLYISGLFSSVYSILEDNTEGLEKKILLWWIIS